MSDIAKLLRATTEQMACTASVDMTLWDKHSNACLEASDKIEELRKDASAAWAMCASISAENEKLRAALEKGRQDWERIDIAHSFRVHESENRQIEIFALEAEIEKLKQFHIDVAFELRGARDEIRLLRAALDRLQDAILDHLEDYRTPYRESLLVWREDALQALKGTSDD